MCLAREGEDLLSDLYNYSIVICIVLLIYYLYIYKISNY